MRHRRSRRRWPEEPRQHVLHELDAAVHQCVSAAKGFYDQREVQKRHQPLERARHGKWHALIDCYGQYRRPVARSDLLLWPAPRASGTL